MSINNDIKAINLNRDFSDYCTLLYPMMFLDTSVGISMYFYHAEIKILNEWLYTPQEGFIPIEVCTAALLS